MNSEEMKKHEARMAEFMGLDEQDIDFGIAIQPHNMTRTVVGGRYDLFDWHPSTDLNQLFKVVDKINEKTGWTFETVDETCESHHSAGFYEQIFRVVDEDFNTYPTRETAIFAACVAALDHIERETK